MKNKILVLGLNLAVGLTLAGCGNYYRIEIKHEKLIGVNERRDIEAEVGGRGRIDQAANAFRAMFKFVNEELMKKERD